MDREKIELLIYGKPDQQRRFTQDFPILPDVWIAYAEFTTKRKEALGKGTPRPSERIELLLTPHARSDAAKLARALRQRLEQETPAIKRYRERHPPKDPDEVAKPARILFNEAVVFADFTFEELLRVALPLTDWWATSVAAPLLAWQKKRGSKARTAKWSKAEIEEFVRALQQPQPVAPARDKKKLAGDPRLLRKLITMIGAIGCDRDDIAPGNDVTEDGKIPPDYVNAFVALLENLTSPTESRGILWGISRNRVATTSIWRSRMAVKADAAARLFEVDTSGIRWAVLDVGIDATHQAFARRDSKKKILKTEPDENGKEQFASRILRTYDFLRIKDLLNPETSVPYEGSYAETLPEPKRKELIEEVQHNLKHERAIDWDLLEQFLRIPHTSPQYEKYRSQLGDNHGTHVAGIVAANWPEAKDTSLDRELYGICPDLELYDLRVLGLDADGHPADEFTIIAALQFVRHLNAHKDLMAIHGVNLSMAVTHDVANYACGRTPICEECERVVANGVVVVTAAGNRGFNKLASPDDGAVGDYRFISITDPGNAEHVITVGSTHRFMPHNYGVSYFSSRGPTGDGRRKPDLVAPGERIDSCAADNGFETMDGTSMAAPHVSGAAAMLIARHRELIGQPERVKDILCKSATDLGREPRFQGAGMLDVLRALQSV